MNNSSIFHMWNSTAASLLTAAESSPCERGRMRQLAAELQILAAIRESAEAGVAEWAGTEFD